jgi:hypothetical protein
MKIRKKEKKRLIKNKDLQEGKFCPQRAAMEFLCDEKIFEDEDLTIENYTNKEEKQYRAP